MKSNRRVKRRKQHTSNVSKFDATVKKMQQEGLSLKEATHRAVETYKKS